MPDILISQFDRKFAQPIETFRSVNTIELRNSIPTGIRWEGMFVYVKTEGLTYTLVGGTTNLFWVNAGQTLNISVENVLTSSSTLNALSANMGRELNEKFASFQPLSEKGLANGYAPLDASAKIPSANLPAFVDDVLEFADLASFPATGSTGILYVALDTNFIYRWSGSTYIQIGGGGAGAVDSVFGRTGAISAAVGDYSSFYVNKDGDTMTGVLTVDGPSGSPLRTEGIGLIADDTAVNIFLAKDSAGTNLWYLGYGSGTNNDIVLYNYDGGGYLRVNAGGGIDGLEYYGGGGTAKVWTSRNDGPGTGLDADLLDSLQSTSFVRADASSTVGPYSTTFQGGILMQVSQTDASVQRFDNRDEGVGSRLHWYGVTESGSAFQHRSAFYDGDSYVNFEAVNNGINIGGSLTAAGFNLSSGLYNNTPSNSRDKVRVWNSGLYAIGMGAGYTFGGLNNDFAMSFQMNSDNDRGFWWGGHNHTNAQGAMSLTTNGRLTVAEYMRLGFGESDTTTPGTTYRLQVNGTIQASNFILSSDKRLKKNFKQHEPKKIPLNLTWFNWGDELKGKRKQLGLIAQEVERTNPEFVITDDQGNKGLSYIEILLAKVSELEGRISQLENC